MLILERFRRVADTNTHPDIEPYAFASSELCSFVSQNSNKYPQLEAQEGANNQKAAPMDNRREKINFAWPFSPFLFF